MTQTVLIKPLIIGAALFLSACEVVPAPQTAHTPQGAEGTTAFPIADTQIAIAAMKELSDDRYEGRLAMTEGNAAARAYISKTAAELNDGIAPTEQSFSRTLQRGNSAPRIIEGVNLITTVPGQSDDGPILEISAHFDHLGVTEAGEIFNGADDNASGVGALFSILKSFKQTPPEHEVRLIWLDAEEGGLNGAFEYVDQQRDGRARLNLNLDMIAQNEDGVIYGSGTFHTPELAPLVKDAAKGTGLSVRLGYDRPEDGSNDWTFQSDHAAWHASGMPFLYLGVEDHPYYHRPTDEFETIPLDVYRKTVQLSVNAAHLLDDHLAELAKVRSTEP